MRTRIYQAQGQAANQAARGRRTARAALPAPGPLPLHRALGNHAYGELLRRTGAPRGRAAAAATSVQRNGSPTEAHLGSAAGQAAAAKYPRTVAGPGFFGGLLGAVPTPEHVEYQRIVAAEKALAGSHFVFYSSASGMTYALHQITKAIWNATHDAAAQAPAKYQFLRAPGTPVKPETAQGPAAFVEAHTRKPLWSDHQASESLLSTNIALFANARTGGTEDSYSILQDGGLGALSFARISASVAGQLALTPYHAATGEVLDVVRMLHDRLAALGHTGDRSAALYQIFVPQDQVGRLAYISSVNGKPVQAEADNPFLDIGLVSAAMGRRGRHYDTVEPNAVADLLTRARTPEFWDHFAKNKDEPQARLLMRPDVFASPNAMLHVETYAKLTQECQAAIDATLTEVRQVLAAHGPDRAPRAGEEAAPRPAALRGINPAQLVSYAVKPGETIAHVAARFGIPCDREDVNVWDRIFKVVEGSDRAHVYPAPFRLRDGVDVFLTDLHVEGVRQVLVRPEAAPAAAHVPAAASSGRRGPAVGKLIDFN